MSRANELNKEYIEMCKTYGHLAYTKKSIEQQMLDLEQKMSLVSQQAKIEQEKEKQETLAALKKA